MACTRPGVLGASMLSISLQVSWKDWIKVLLEGMSQGHGGAEHMIEIQLMTTKKLILSWGTLWMPVASHSFKCHHVQMFPCPVQGA